MVTSAKKKTKTKAPDLPPNAFIGRATKPRHADVVKAIGATAGLWDSLVAGLETEFALTQEWKSFSPKYGWALRLKKKDRNIVHLGPCEGEFRVTIILGAK